jgi:hypothetical protein
MVWVETPTNPMLKLADLHAIAAMCRERGIISVCDNTFASPIVQRPLEHGIDIVVHSTTKYMNGHSDVIGGVAVVGRSAAPGAGANASASSRTRGRDPGPFDSFLVLRGIKTLALRVERSCSQCAGLAQWLEQQPQGQPRLLPGPGVAPAARAGAAPDARLRRHHLDRPRHRPGRRAPLPGALRGVHPGRKPGRRREPDRASGHDDPCHHSGPEQRAAAHTASAMA